MGGRVILGLCLRYMVQVNHLQLYFYRKATKSSLYERIINIDENLASLNLSIWVQTRWHIHYQTDKIQLTHQTTTLSRTATYRQASICSLVDALKLIPGVRGIHVRDPWLVHAYKILSKIYCEGSRRCHFKMPNVLRRKWEYRTHNQWLHNSCSQGGHKARYCS